MTLGASEQLFAVEPRSSTQRLMEPHLSACQAMLTDADRATPEPVIEKHQQAFPVKLREAAAGHGNDAAIAFLKDLANAVHK